jgi:hypothetical protein
VLRGRELQKSACLDVESTYKQVSYMVVDQAAATILKAYNERVVKGDSIANEGCSEFDINIPKFASGYAVYFKPTFRRGKK